MPSKAQLILSKVNAVRSWLSRPFGDAQPPGAGSLVNPAARLNAKVAGGGSSNATWASARNSGPERQEFFEANKLPSPRVRESQIPLHRWGMKVAHFPKHVTVKRPVRNVLRPNTRVLSSGGSCSSF